jgi:hypothetical protein
MGGEAWGRDHAPVQVRHYQTHSLERPTLWQKTCVRQPAGAHQDQGKASSKDAFGEPSVATKSPSMEPSPRSYTHHHRAARRVNSLFHTLYVDATPKPRPSSRKSPVRVFLFYGHAVDPTMLTAVNKISMEQAKPHSKPSTAYSVTPHAIPMPLAVVFKPSNMQLCGQSDTSYISETGARSRAVASYTLWSQPGW